MTDRYSISGRLTDKDVKRLTKLTRGATVGPTVVYYAGVTAPIISAAMAMMVREAVRMLGLSDYWQWFVSALIAAFAGITWYLIFIRWSYRHTHGRGTEVSLETRITLTDQVLILRRGEIETHIGWSAIESVESARGHTSILVAGADALIVPHRWFDKDKAARSAFIDELKHKVNENGA